MANVNVPICLRSSDGKLIAIDTNCNDVQMPACLNAIDGKLWIYHTYCDGIGGSDGWYQLCPAAGGGLQITIPDDCCEADCPDYCSSGCPGHEYRLVSADFDVVVDNYTTGDWNSAWECACDWGGWCSALLAGVSPSGWSAWVRYTKEDPWEGAFLAWTGIEFLVCDGVTNVTWQRETYPVCPSGFDLFPIADISGTISSV